MLSIKLSQIIHALYKLLIGKRSLGQLVNQFKYKTSKMDSPIVNYRPIRLGIFVFSGCNLSCDMCLTHSRKIPNNPYKYQGAKEMDLSLFKDIINRFPRTIITQFIGNGEPLLCKDLFKMVKYAKSRKISTSLCTNGYILNNFIKDILFSHLDEINISVNGHTPSDYGYFTGQSDKIFNQIIKNVCLLTAAKRAAKFPLKISVSMIIDRNNYKHIPQKISFAESLGVDSLSLYQHLSGYSNNTIINDKTLYIFDREVHDYFMNLNISSKYISVSLPPLLDGNKNNRICRDSFVSMSIDGDGNVGGCERQMLNTVGAGKYYDRNIFNSKHFVCLRSMLLDRSFPLMLPCQTCYNNTTCRSLTILRTGNNNV